MRHLDVGRELTNNLDPLSLVICIIGIWQVSDFLGENPTMSLLTLWVNKRWCEHNITGWKSSWKKAKDQGGSDKHTTGVAKVKKIEGRKTSL